MSGFEIYTKREKFAWDIACMDIGVTFVALSAIFVALFSVFSIPYKISCVYFLQAIAIPLAIFVVWGRKYRIPRYAALLLTGILSYFLLGVNAFHGVVSCVNSAIRLINKCYNINLSQFSGYGTRDGKISFLWVLCVLECLFAILFLTILKQGRRRFYGIFVFLLPVVLGIFCGKVPEVFEGCCLVLAIFFFLIASYQREHVPVKALLSALVLLLGVWLGARSIESSIYAYKEDNLGQYQDIKNQLIEARGDISNWLPEALKKINIEKNESNKEPQINMGVGWNKELQTLSSVSHSGKIVDEVILDSEPTSTVYWPKFVGYVYTGNGWEEKGATGVYDELDKMRAYCASVWIYSNDEIFQSLNENFEKNFIYTKNPGKMPEDMDFVEGFMFKVKKGFCVHFATAATVIYQMRNREARYMEGYMLLPSDFKQQSDGTYKAVVRDYMAHAWCETYEERRGWTVREHTISSGLRTENPTQTPTKTPTRDPEVTLAPTTTPAPNITGTPSIEPSQEAKPTLPPLISSEGEGEKGNLKEFLLIIWGTLKSVMLYLFGIGTVIGMMCALILLQQKIRFQQKNRRFNNKQMKKAILAVYRAIQELCIFEGLKDREVWRRENMSKVAEKFPPISLQEWEWMYDCVERTMFSNDVMQPEEQKQIYALYQKLRKGILKSLNGGRKIWFLYGRVL